MQDAMSHGREGYTAGGSGRNAEVLGGLLFVVGAAGLCHLAFSWMGFNPTDDGFILAQSRRLLDGEIPYRDFISIQTPLSPLLHLPIVLWGGDYTFLISRLVVWIEFAAAAWWWTLAVLRLAAKADRLIVAVPLAATAMLFSSHSFPIMAWNTIDGLFLAALGAFLCTRDRRLAGYFILGLAYLCKQNFLPLAVLAVWLWGDAKRQRAWLAAAAPGLVFIVLLAVSGALPDAFRQLTARTELLESGVYRYLWEFGFAWGLLFGWIIGLTAAERPRIAFGAVLGILTAAAISLGKGQFLWAPAFGLVGIALGAFLPGALRERPLGGGAKATLFAGFAAWCASISFGYNTPALAAGMPVAAILALTGCSMSHRFKSAALAALALFSAFQVWTVRNEHVYLDRPAAELTWDLAGIFPGAAGIRTNAATAAVLSDLRDIVASERVAGKTIAILPDFAGYWAASTQRNPLPIDWPLGDILIRDDLIERVVDGIRQRRGSLAVLVEKFHANSLAQGVRPLPAGDRYRVVKDVRQFLTKTGETAYFEIFE